MIRTFLVATYLQDKIPNFVIIKNLSETPNEKKKKKIRKMKKIGQENYIQDIKELDNLNLHQFKDVNSMFDASQNNLIEIIDINNSSISHCLKNRVTLNIKSGKPQVFLNPSKTKIYTKKIAVANGNSK